ncbi:hypothetical protein D3C77_440830 [compost metagenome]
MIQFIGKYVIRKNITACELHRCAEQWIIRMIVVLAQFMNKQIKGILLMISNRRFFLVNGLNKG